MKGGGEGAEVQPVDEIVEGEFEGVRQELLRKIDGQEQLLGTTVKVFITALMGVLCHSFSILLAFPTASTRQQRCRGLFMLWGLTDISLLPMALKVRLQITHKDMRRAEELKAWFVHKTKPIEEMTGHKLPLSFEIDQLREP